MKTLFVVLFPILILAQIPNPDTLVLKNGQVHPCFITSIDDTKIEIVYDNSRKETVILKAIDQISIEELGTIYFSDNGFTNELDQITDFVEKRREERQDELIALNEIEHHQKSCETNYWSFGVLYIPYYSAEVYRTIYNNYQQQPPEIYSYSNYETNLEGQLSYGILSDIRITLDVTYSSLSEERRYEQHVSGNYQYDSGHLNEYSIKMIDFSLGLKYYIKEILSEKVSAYILAGIGKQFAFAKYKYEILFSEPPDPPYTHSDNQEEFMEQLNSPWHFNFGFGAEYFFNQSLSLTSNIRFIYSAISANYHSLSVSEFDTQRYSTEYKNSDFVTRVGLGLNFYF